ncbi:bcl-2-related ovarian killer protein-like [Dermacentor andersoni]|uniref:bcl-2-related ovarian killer protein-like n=1 Tax=Dermacentor andersoni TaxID=34620 RepID=UPI0021553744|nr:bcl-2-related ovarian killer protein-like [Dermacentor andersoni]
MAGLLQPPSAANGNAGGAGAGGGLSAPSSPCLGNRLTVPGSQGPRDRKYSLPLQLQRRPSLSGYAAAVESAREDARRRKFSQVGQVVSHRLSTTIGWKVYTVTTQEVADQAKSLCGRYLRAKLKQCGAVNKKLGLQRLRSVTNLSVGYPTSDVAQRLRLVCSELESSHPDLYQTVTGNIGVHALPSETAVQNVFEAVARELFRNDISWGRIVALYSVSGGLAVDCVKLGHPEYVLGLVQALGLFVERDLATWISQQGGWGTLITRFRRRPQRSILVDFLLIVAGLVLVVVLLYYWLS